MSVKTDKPKPTIPIFRCEGLLIPVDRLKASDIQAAHERFTYRFYNEKGCKSCDNLQDRHSDICDSCKHFKGAKQTSKIVEKEGMDFLSLPAGAGRKVKKWLTGRGMVDRYKILSRTPDAPRLSRPIKIVKDPYPYQEEAADVLIKKKRGILESPPRSGKTVMATVVIARIGLKTLILGSQMEWLLQFRETFVGSDTQEKFTNCRQANIKVCRNLKDFQDTDICLSTFSKFMSPGGKKLLEKIRDLFGVIVIDECHFTPALETSRVVSRLNAEYMFGLSGTVERKVTEEIQIANDLIGPIIHSCEVERLRPRVQTFFSNVKIKDPPKGGSQAGFTYFQSRLESHAERRAKIIKQIIKFARAGHLVLVPLTRVNSVLNWTREINYETEVPGFALPFFGGLKKDRRRDVIQKARNGECRVLVGNISLLSTGLNIPRASCLVESVCTSNIPKCDQRVSRILTPLPGKPTPIILLVLDDSDLMRRCRQNEWWNCIAPRFDPIIPKDESQALLEYFAATNSNKPARHANLREGLE